MASKQLTQEQVNQIFDEFDTQKSGQLNVTGVFNAIKKIHSLLGLDLPILGNVFARIQFYDKNNSGLTEKNEFTQIVLCINPHIISGAQVEGKSQATEKIVSANDGAPSPHAPAQIDLSKPNAKGIIDALVEPHFRKYDANGTGQLDFGELEKAISELSEMVGKPKMSYSNILDIMTSLDKDKSHFTDLPEFRKFVAIVCGFPY